MALGHFALADQPTVPRSSFLSGLAQWGQHCSAALDSSRQAHGQPDTAQNTTQLTKAATSLRPEGLHSSPSDSVCHWESPSSSGTVRPQQRHSRERSGQFRGTNKRSIRWRGSGTNGISAPQSARRAPLGTMMLAAIPHANYLLTEPSPPTLRSLFMLSDTVRYSIRSSSPPICHIYVLRMTVMDAWERPSKRS